MNRADAICRNDIEPGEYVPTDVCIDCEADVPVGVLRCPDCERAANDREEFETNNTRTDDPRR